MTDYERTQKMTPNEIAARNEWRAEILKEDWVTDPIKTVRAAIAFLSNEEGQDRSYTLEMVEQMLFDITTGQFHELEMYVRRYCNIITNAEEAEEIARGIKALKAQGENE